VGVAGFTSRTADLNARPAAVTAPHSAIVAAFALLTIDTESD